MKISLENVTCYLYFLSVFWIKIVNFCCFKFFEEIYWAFAERNCRGPWFCDRLSKDCSCSLCSWCLPGTYRFPLLRIVLFLSVLLLWHLHHQNKFYLICMNNWYWKWHQRICYIKFLLLSLRFWVRLTLWWEIIIKAFCPLCKEEFLSLVDPKIEPGMWEVVRISNLRNGKLT